MPVGVLVHVGHDKVGMQRTRIRERQARDDAQRLRIPVGRAQAQCPPDLGGQRQWRFRRPVGRPLLDLQTVGGQEGKP